jgi:hypothetical protein
MLFLSSTTWLLPVARKFGTAVALLDNKICPAHTQHVR